MARKKIAKRTKRPPIATPFEIMETRLNSFSDHAIAQFREIQSALNCINITLGRVENRQTDGFCGEPPFTAKQFEQLRMAVNKIAAYAAAMDETKKTMIKLTSARIDKLDQRMMKLRVRLNRLNG